MLTLKYINMSVETLDFPVLNVPDLDILESGFGNGKN